MDSISLPCNLCGHQETRALYAQVRQHQLQPEDVRMTTDIYAPFGQIVKCRQCGLVYTNPRLPDQAIAQAYQNLEDLDYMNQQDCRSINAHLSLQTIKRFCSSGRLLDVGCSTGFFLNAARIDFDVHGVEPSEWASQFARKKLKLEIHTGDLRDVPPDWPPFDVTTLIDVLEHVVDPSMLMRDIALRMRPGGLLYLVTPDISSLSARLLGRYWWGFRPAHLHYFSPKTLVKLLQKTGFRVHEIRSYGRIFTYGYWLSRIRLYPRWFYEPLRMLIRLWGVENKVVYINTRDSMEVCAERL
jgi:2-polyprenyl-3-methyl-5-hydroxy-6-metoxy-1,4-benzoquinol methylase